MVTDSERKQIQAETLLEVIKALAQVGPSAGMVGHWFGKLSEQLATRTEQLVQEARALR
jgi:hypothetical protein